MTHNKTKRMKAAYLAWSKSNLFSLSHCYGRHSIAKECAWGYCLNLMNNDAGQSLRVVSYNPNMFTAGYIAFEKYTNREIFVYITPHNDFFAYVDELA